MLAAATGSANLTNATGGTLTLSPGITVRGRSGTFSNGGAASAVVNRGVVRAEVAGATITINGGTFRNEGTLRAVGGGRLTVAGLVGNVGDVAVTDAGSSLRLEGTGHVLDRDITVPAGTTLELGGTWSNRAAIHVAGGALSLQGNFATADLGTIDRPGGAGTVTIAGLLRNAGATLALNAATGPWSLGVVNGSIQGGTVTTADGVALLGKNGTLDGVTLAGSMLVGDNWNIQVRNGLTLNAATITLGDAARVGTLSFVGGTQTLGGTGEVVFTGPGTSAINNGTTGATLTIAPGVTVRGRNGEITNGAGFGIGTIVSHGTLRAEEAGGTIRVTGGTFSNRGTLVATGGGKLFVENMTGDVGPASASGFGSALRLAGAGSGFVLDRDVSATASATLTLAGPWSNRATVRVNDSTLNLDGTFTTAGMGNIRRSGGTVNLLGVLDNTGATLRLDAASGSWVVGGTIRGGRIVATDDARVLSSLGRYERVTLAGAMELAGNTFTATFVDGLVMDGGSVFLKGSGSFPARVFFNSAAPFDLSGTGQFVYPAAGSSTFTNTSAGLTIGAGITFRGGGVLLGSNSSVVLHGTIISEVPNTFFLVGIGTAGTFTNRGNIRALNGAGFRVDCPLVMGEGGTLAVSPGSFVQLLGHLVGTTRNSAAYQPLGNMLLTGGGFVDNPVLFEAMSRDVGTTAGAGPNFQYSTLTVRTRYTRLVDQSDNAPGTEPEAVYADSLYVSETSTLDLNGLHLYARHVRVLGTLLNGTVTRLPEGQSLEAGVPAPGNIATPGEADNWAFFGRAGDAVTVELNTGSVLDLLLPGTLWGDVELRDAADRLLGKVTATGQEGVTVLRDVVLPEDGTYRVVVRAAASHANSTGAYSITLYLSPTAARPLSLDALTASRLGTPASADRWRFQGTSGQAVRLDVLAPNASARYTLTGPTGTALFTDLADDSDVVTLDRDGEYTLTVRSRAFEVAYPMVLWRVGEDALSVGVPFQGLVSRGGEARLFRLRVPTAGPLRLRLDAPPSAGDRFELHARFGTRPSRGSAAFQSTDVTAGGGLLVPYAAAGDWYVLLYAASVGFLPSPPRVYTLLATRPDVTLADVSPSRAGNTGTATLGVTGAGFGPGTAVSLVAAGGATFAASSTDVDSATALSATFDLRLVPPGVYDVRVDASPSASATLPAAFTVVAAGAPRLQTRLEMPSDLGRHATATIYVHYANTGDAPMPAPLLLLESADDDGSDRPLLTLDARRVAQGFWTTAAPEGFGNTVQFLASGRTPGVLLPGESPTVPVYYAGLQPPWDFSDRRVELGLRIFRSSDATPIDWAALAAARPPQFDAETWRPLSANLRAIVGETWGGYVAMLDAQATALARQGEAVNDVGQLWNVALRRANGLAPFGTLDDAVDAFVPTPGIALAFGRTFSTTLSARHQAGPLGRGWWTPWQARLSVRPDGTVVIVGRDNSQRRFQPDSRRATAYFSLPNDHGTLSPLSAGGFILREADGTVSVFRPDGRPEYVQDPNGNRVTASYDGAGRLTALTHSAGQSLALAYNPAGLIESVTDSAGRTAEYTYDAANEHLVSVRWFDGRVTRYTYGGGGDAATAHALLSVRRPDDSVRHFTYDARGRLSGTYVNDHVGAATFAEEGPTGLRITDASGASSRLYFNQFGLPSRAVDATGRFANVAYDAALEVSRVTDAAGQPSSYRHDAAGNLTQSTNPLGMSTRFQYAGPLNRLIGLVDAAGNATRYEYDTRGNLVAVTYADGSVSRATYDARGNLVSATNRRGQTVQYAYNNGGQVTRVTLPGGAEMNYTYGPRGNLLTVADASGTTTFTYDSGDRVTKVTYPNGRFVAYTYDAAGRRTSVTDHTDFAVNYTYDTAGRLVRISAGGGGLISSFSYDPTGRLARRDHGNGTYTTYEYDAAWRVTHLVNHALGGAVNSRFDYTYNTLGRPTAASTLDGAWAYSYDPLGELTRAVFTSTNPSVPGQDLRYAYDATGNRTVATVNGTAVDYDANGLNQYTNVGGVSFVYDAGGNLVAEGDTAYAYDAIGRLTSIVTPSGTWVYEYDALGNRSAAVHNGQRTEYLLDPTGLGNVVGEYDGGGNLRAHYSHGPGLGLASRTDATGSNWHYYDFDRMGSTAGLSDGTRAYANRYTYLPFGETVGAVEGVANPFEFNGELGVMSEGNGLLFMRARYMDVGLGRFLSPDPIGIAGGLNLYSFAANTPTRLADANGYAPSIPVTIEGPPPPATRLRPAAPRRAGRAAALPHRLRERVVRHRAGAAGVCHRPARPRPRLGLVRADRVRFRRHPRDRAGRPPVLSDRCRDDLQRPHLRGVDRRGDQRLDQGVVRAVHVDRPGDVAAAGRAHRVPAAGGRHRPRHGARELHDPPEARPAGRDPDPQRGDDHVRREPADRHGPGGPARPVARDRPGETGAGHDRRDAAGGGAGTGLGQCVEPGVPGVPPIERPRGRRLCHPARTGAAPRPSVVEREPFVHSVQRGRRSGSGRLFPVRQRPGATRGRGLLLRPADVYGDVDARHAADGRRYRVSLPGTVRDRVGNVLGDGFTVAFNALPGDATRDGRVNALDLVQVRRKLTRTVADPGSGVTRYTPFDDINGDGRISVLDIGALRRRLYTQLPTAPAPLPVSPTANGRSDLDDPATGLLG